MGGWQKISTHDVTARAPRSPCSKSKTLANASAAIPSLSGHLMKAGFVLLKRYCSTYLAKGTSKTKEQAGRYTVPAGLGLILVEMVTVSYVHINHLMVMVVANHMQMSLVIVSQLMVMVKTCSLTTRMKNSQ